jgi:hypothetical protein
MKDNITHNDISEFIMKNYQVNWTQRPHRFNVYVNQNQIDSIRNYISMMAENVATIDLVPEGLKDMPWMGITTPYFEFRFHLSENFRVEGPVDDEIPSKVVEFVKVETKEVEI